MTVLINKNYFFSFLMETICNLLIVLFVAVFLISCSEKETVPENIIQPKLMQSVIWDYVKADVYASEFIRKDSTKNDSMELLKMQKLILQHYHVSEELYKKSYEYYLNHPLKLSAILDSINANRNRLGFEKETDRHSVQFR